MYRLLTLFLITLMSKHFLFRASSEDDVSYLKCDTDECKKIGSEIRDGLDLTVDPCENFYQFACGGWIKEHPANASNPMIILYSLVSTSMQDIREILEDESKPEDTATLQKARQFYNMCMDVDELESVGITTLKRFVDDNGGWPLIMSTEEWKTKNFTWQEVSDIIQENGFPNGIYTISVIVDDKNSTQHIITIEEPTLIMQREMLLNLEVEPAEKDVYISFIREVAQLFINKSGILIDDETLTQDIHNVVDFEIELAKLMMSRERSRDIDEIYNELTIDDLQIDYDAQNPVEAQIDWHVIDWLFLQEGIVIEPSEEKLLVQAYEYLMNLVPLLERISSRTIINHMQWNIIRDMLPFGNAHMEAISSRYNAQYHGFPINDFRWEACVQKYNVMPAISHEYAKRHVPNESKEDVKNMITEVMSSVGEQISASTWMDNETKTASLEKLGNMRGEVSTPEWYSDEAIDNFYNGLIITSNYLESAINLSKFMSKKEIRSLKEPVNKIVWATDPIMINAFYQSSENAIIITAAIMQNPFYNNDLPAYLNYAGLGYVIGHEVHHGFDDVGRKYDKDGNYNEWWTPESITKFEDLSKCFVEQYNNYVLPGLGESENVTYVNGVVSLGENLGDTNGIIAAYKAYQNRKRKLNEPDIQLPGLENYTNDQIFFINTAHVFCDSVTPEIAHLFVNEHSRWETRIDGSLSNFPEFSKVFNCPAGKKMNPDKKCYIWE